MCVTLAESFIFTTLIEYYTKHHKGWKIDIDVLRENNAVQSSPFLPLLITSYLTSNDNSKITKLFHFCNLSNFTFHSYFSVSTIITDYVKPKLISNIVRKSNFGLHLLAFTGYSNLIIKN